MTQPLGRGPGSSGYPEQRVRCAIYTRKSSEDGLEQEFNSLDDQYEACAAYIASRKAEGWVLPRFRRMRSLQKFVTVHSSVNNHLNQERHLYSRYNFKLKRTAALAECRQLGAA